MLCKYCGKAMNSTATVCPFCGTPVAAPEQPSVAAVEKPAEVKIEQPKAEKKSAAKKSASPVMKTEGISINLINSIVCAVLSIACLISVISLKSTVSTLEKQLSAQLNQVSENYSGIQKALEDVSNSVSSAQQSAYQQFAEQSISITKDLTSLTGPVSEGKFNQMFIINAKGSLDLDNSFDWQRYNAETGGWTSVVFTGNATSNEQYGLRLENRVEKKDGESVYISILWANGITQEGAGTYRCVVIDNNGVKRTSSEAVVQVAPAE